MQICNWLALTEQVDFAVKSYRIQSSEGEWCNVQGLSTDCRSYTDKSGTQKGMATREGTKRKEFHSYNIEWWVEKRVLKRSRRVLKTGPKGIAFRRNLWSRRSVQVNCAPILEVHSHTCSCEWIIAISNHESSKRYQSFISAQWGHRVLTKRDGELSYLWAL